MASINLTENMTSKASVESKGQLSSDMCVVLYFSLGVFVYALIVSFLLQTVVIPRVFSNPDAVKGLVVLDSIGFDGVARVKAEEIARNGWSAWELRPSGHMPAGIASAFYTIWKPVPYSVLPFNALVHAIAAGVTLLILRSFFLKLPALLGALVFALNPAAMEWVAQIHRDGVFICGNLMFVFAMIKLNAKVNDNDNSCCRIAIAMLLAVAIFGIGIVWIARPYWIQVMMLSSVMCFFISAIDMKSSWAKQTRVCGVLRMLGVATLILLQVWIVRSYGQFEPVDMSLVPSFGMPRGEEDGAHSASMSWVRTAWIPDFMEELLYRIAISRRSVLAHGGGSVIDSDRFFQSGVEVIAYIPRALQVGVLSPFPSLWAGQASTSAMVVGRKIVGGATFLFYICLVGSAVSFVKMRAWPGVWTMVVLCLIGILVYAMTYPNIGTLMRYRYGFYMLIVAFGAAYWSSIFFKLRHEARSSPLKVLP